MGTTNNNNGTKKANNNGTTTEQLQPIVLGENVKFTTIPGTYIFGDFAIYVESKQTGATHGEKTLYFGDIAKVGSTEQPIPITGWDITKIKKAVGCNFKRVYISNADGATIPKCKNLTDDNIAAMVESLEQNVSGVYLKLYDKLHTYLADSEELLIFIDSYNKCIEKAKIEYQNRLKEEQLRISIENKEKEQKRQAKQATRDAKNINTTTAEGIIQAQIIQAMMAGDFATLADLTQKLQTLQSK